MRHPARRERSDRSRRIHSRAGSGANFWYCRGFCDSAFGCAQNDEQLGCRIRPAKTRSAAPLTAHAHRLPLTASAYRYRSRLTACNPVHGPDIRVLLENQRRIQADGQTVRHPARRERSDRSRRIQSRAGSGANDWYCRGFCDSAFGCAQNDEHSGCRIGPAKTRSAAPLTAHRLPLPASRFPLTAHGSRLTACNPGMARTFACCWRTRGEFRRTAKPCVILRAGSEATGVAGSSPGPGQAPTFGIAVDSATPPSAARRMTSTRVAG